MNSPGTPLAAAHRAGKYQEFTHAAPTTHAETSRQGQ